MFLEDCKTIDKELMEEIGVSLAEQQKNFYDYLHFSPIKVCSNDKFYCGQEVMQIQ